ncbi:MAG: hypothetical protein KKI08_02185, partial [Armatimonadetes bacterium]|nr:hypothetical protein [Armatimonadota bacterium]
SQVEDLATTSLDGCPVTPLDPLPNPPTYDDYCWEAGVRFPGFAPGPQYYKGTDAYCLGSIQGTGMSRFTVFWMDRMLTRGRALLDDCAGRVQAQLNLDLTPERAGLFAISLEVSPTGTVVAPAFAAALLTTYELLLLGPTVPMYADTSSGVSLLALAQINPCAGVPNPHHVDLAPVMCSYWVRLRCRQGHENDNVPFWLHAIHMHRI